MEHIEVKHTPKDYSILSAFDISKEFEFIHSFNYIEKLPWKEFNYKPDVKFKILYDKYFFYLKYYVKEKYIMALKTGWNEPVSRDTCVEFFITPEKYETFKLTQMYYNYEFNCIGNYLIGFGNNRYERDPIHTSFFKELDIYSSMEYKQTEHKEGNFSWDLTIKIPKESMFLYDGDITEVKEFRANFYKCGDDLKEPHYVVWNNINTPKPNYHSPEYFGKLILV